MTLKELKIRYPLLKETKYIHKNSYKTILENIDKIAMFDRIYNYSLTIYEKNLKHFNDLQDHLKTELPKKWLEYLGNPNYIELNDNKSNIKTMREMLKSGFYKVKFYQSNMTVSAIILINPMQNYDSLETIMEKKQIEIKKVFSEIGDSLKKMGL
jgi:hypothetical protein